MSVATASGAVSTPRHQATQEQIRLAQLVDDKKHDHPEVQDIVRKVLEVVPHSNTEHVIFALIDCDYDCEKAIARLMEEGSDVASEWRTATNHKPTKKQQQKSSNTTKNGHGEFDENGQSRGSDGSSYRGKTRGANGGGSTNRPRYQQQQQNGGDSHQMTSNQSHSNENSNLSTTKARRGSSYRGRYRGPHRPGQRPNDRTHSLQGADGSNESSGPSDNLPHLTDIPHGNRRGRGAATGTTHPNPNRQPHQEQWDVGNWDGETLIYSRSAKDDATAGHSEDKSHVLSEVPNGSSKLNHSDASKPDFDPVEAARQIKNVIGIGQAKKPTNEIKQLMPDQKPKSKGTAAAAPLTTKAIASPPPLISGSARIPHQPVIFSDHFDGGIPKIDVEFGNLNETFNENLTGNLSIPTSSSSSAAAFYTHSQPVPVSSSSSAAAALTKPPSTSMTTNNGQRTHEQVSYISPAMRSTEQHSQQPVMNPQRLLPTQMQQAVAAAPPPSMTMKPVVTPQYAVQQQQHQMNQPNMYLQSLLFHQPGQQAEPVTLDNAYDPTAAFQLSSMDFTTPFYMAAPISQPTPQQQAQARYVIPQPMSQPTTLNRQPSVTTIQTPAISTASTSAANSSNLPKKAPAIPPGIFPPTGPPPSQPIYSTTFPGSYGIPHAVGQQQQTAATAYSTPYDPDRAFTNAFMQMANSQQAQSPTATFGSVTPPIQQQQQQQQGNNGNNDNKGMNYRGPLNENLMLLQQYSLQQSNSQQQGQQAAGHSTAPLNYFIGRPPGGSSYSPGPTIMYAQPPTAAAMSQQSHMQKQAGQPYNLNTSSSSLGVNDDYYGRVSTSSLSTKEPSYMYNAPNQNQPPSNVQKQQHQHQHQHQQQHQQRTNSHAYNNQQQRPYQ